MHLRAPAQRRAHAALKRKVALHSLDTAYDERLDEEVAGCLEQGADPAPLLAALEAEREEKKRELAETMGTLERKALEYEMTLQGQVHPSGDGASLAAEAKRLQQKFEEQQQQLLQELETERKRRVGALRDRLRRRSSSAGRSRRRRRRGCRSRTRTNWSLWRWTRSTRKKRYVRRSNKERERESCA